MSNVDIANMAIGAETADRSQTSVQVGKSLVNNTRPWPEPLADEAFHGLAGEFVFLVEPHTEADTAALLTDFLTLAGSLIGREPHAIAEADRHGCNLYVLQVGETSKARKGTAYGQTKKVFELADPLWVKNNIASGSSTKEGIAYLVRDPVEKEIKGEVVTIDEGVKDKRLLLYEPEFAGVLKVADRQGNTLTVGMREAWDAGNIRTITKNSPTRATDTHMSCLAHITRDELLKHLNDTEICNGFANRLLFVCVRRSKTLPEGGGTVNYGDFIERLNRSIEKARTIDHVRRDEESTSYWASIYPELSEGRPGLLGAITARAEAQVLRLSVIYAVLDGESIIRQQHLAAALAVWEYCDASASYIFGDALGDPVADRIISGLKQCPEGLTRSDLHSLFGRHIPAAKLDTALGMLLSKGLVLRQSIDTQGRRSEIWLISPNSLNSQIVER